MQNLIFTRLAENDLLEVIEYIAQDSPVAAYEVHTAILETCEMLSKQPGIAQVAFTNTTDDLRRAVVKKYPSYLIFYRKIESGIEVIRLGEGHRDWSSILG